MPLRSGAVVPKGTVLWMSVIALHTSTHNFEQPMRFWPERWTQPKQPEQEQDGVPHKPAGSAAGAASAHGSGSGDSSGAGGGGGCPFASLGRPTPAGNSAALQRSFMPFSQGPRDCLGQVRAPAGNNGSGR